MPDRYRRQKAYAHIGEAGQLRLANARVVLCGMGALGAMVAERLCRAGIGWMRLIDRDWVEIDNLPRQALYTTEDAMHFRPKALAAQEHLRAINPDIQLEAIVEDVTFENAEKHFTHVDCIIDGTDNFETRYLINDVAFKHGIPWVHAGIVGASGQSMTFVPGKTSCFRCLMPDPPPPEQMQTCDSAGVLGPAVGVIASWQAMEAIKILVGSNTAGDGALRVFDLWSGDVRRIRVQPAQSNANAESNETQTWPASSGCKVCIQHDYEFLTGKVGTAARVLCGRGAVQIQSSGRDRLNLDVLATRLKSEGSVMVTPHLLRFACPPNVISIFADGRAIVQGTENPDEARKIYTRWIGG